MTTTAWAPLLALIPAIGLVLIGFSAHDSGAFERVPCGRVVQQNTENAELGDRFIEGYVVVGFDFDVTIQQAAATLDSLGAHWAFDYPYNHSADVCTLPGEEEKWANQLAEADGVQYAHREGVNPLDIEN